MEDKSSILEEKLDVSVIQELEERKEQTRTESRKEDTPDTPLDAHRFDIETPLLLKGSQEDSLDSFEKFKK